MRIERIIESLYKDDFEILSSTLYKNEGKVLHGTFTLQDESNKIEYMVDLFIDKETKKYKIESIFVADGDQDSDGDKQDFELINFYLSNNIGYVLNYILENGS
jgi:lipopolysaccharide export LptBFGC system permease protein LptF